jgi:hypothetical protein
MATNRLVFFGIGIAKPTGMVALPGVYNSINGYIEWANSQGYEAISLTDETAPVVASDIGKRLTDMFEKPVYRLVIAFVGHGFQNSTDQMWILSDGPDVNTGRVSRDALRGSLRTYGPQQISIISDACRESRYFESGTVSILNDRPNPPKKVFLDLFSSTLANQPAFAFRAKPDQEASCLFSAVMLDFLCGRDQRAFQLAAGNSADVTTQTIYNSLPDALLERGAILGVNQEPDISPGFKYGEDVYSRFESPSPAPEPPYARPTVLLRYRTNRKSRPRELDGEGLLPQSDSQHYAWVETFGEVAPLAKGGGAVVDAMPKRVPLSYAQLLAKSEFNFKSQPAIENKILQKFVQDAAEWEEEIAAVVHQSGAAPGWGHIVNEAPTGHIVSPVKLDSGAYWSPITWSDLDERIPYVGRRASQMLTLSWHSEEHEEFFAMIPMFKHLIAQVHFWGDDRRSGGVSALSWFPDYDAKKSLQGLTLAAQQALFLLEKGQLRAGHAHEIASHLRIAKHANPLLGIVCAYLYDLIGDLDSINRMCHFYVAHAQPIPFDIAMLAGGELRRAADRPGLVTSFKNTKKDKALASNRALAHLDYLWRETPDGEGSVAGVAPLLRVGWPRIGTRSELNWARRLFNAGDALASSPISTLVGRRGKVAALETLEDLGLFEERLYDWRP